MSLDGPGPPSAQSPQSRLGARGQGASAERDHLQPVSSGTSESEEQVKVWRTLSARGVLEQAGTRGVCGSLWGQGGPELGGWSCSRPAPPSRLSSLSLLPSEGTGEEVQLAGDWGSSRLPVVGVGSERKGGLEGECEPPSGPGAAHLDLPESSSPPALPASPASLLGPETSKQTLGGGGKQPGCWAPTAS